jgi:hypothetical protein
VWQDPISECADPNPVSGAARLKIESVGRCGESDGPRRSVSLLIDDSVFGVVELSAISGACPKIGGGSIGGRAGFR